LVAQFLQFTVSTLLAEHAEMVSFGENKLQNQATILLKLLRMGFHHQSIPGRIGTSRDWSPLPLDFHHTHSTSPDIAQPFKMAKGRQINAIDLTNLKNSVSFFPLDLPIVDR
jgi:hypothetical protein